MGKKKRGSRGDSGSWAAVEDEALNFTFKTTRAKKKRKSKDDTNYQRSYYERNKERLSERAAERWRDNEGGYRDRALKRAKSRRSIARGLRAAEKFDQQRSNYTSGWWCRACEAPIHKDKKDNRPKVCPECGAEGGIERAVIVTVGLCSNSKCKRTVPWDGEERKCGVELKGGRTCRGTIEEAEQVLRTKTPRLVRASDVGESKKEDGADEAWVYSSGVLAANVGKSPSTIRTWIEERVIPGYSIKLSGRYWFTTRLMDAVGDGYQTTLLFDGRAPHSTLRRKIIEEIEKAGVPYKPFHKKD